MTQLEWQKLEELVLHMTPEEKARLVALVQAAPAAPLSDRKKSRLVGLMADAPELMDAVVESANSAREKHPLRLPTDE